ncbi:MAG: LacI family DNA-binding transcriptional regulator [Solobacterium sp.]|nr:LacI family DNA-binding transcriptional regulator [Solobacterium sp.]
MRLKNKDIAEKLGISTTAVSLALNNRPGVSEATRRQVLELVNSSAAEAIQVLNDESDLSTRSILLSVHKKHGEIINDKPFFSDLIETTQQELMKHSYNMILSHFVPGQSLPQYIQYIKSLPISGVIIMATELEEEDLSYYRQLTVPIVLMDGFFDLEPIDSVSLDNQAAMFRAVDFAVKMGHQQIGYLQSATSITNFRHSMDGFMKGIREYGLEAYPHPIIKLPCNVQGAYEEMNRFLDHPPKDFRLPTLFLAELDYIALGAMSALQEHGFRIPEDVSMIGYDDLSISAISSPPLTTTSVNHMDIGRFSAKILLDRISDPHDCHTSMQISSELVIRSSVKKLSD